MKPVIAPRLNVFTSILLRSFPVLRGSLKAMAGASVGTVLRLLLAASEGRGGLDDTKSLALKNGVGLRLGKGW